MAKRNARSAGVSYSAWRARPRMPLSSREESAPSALLLRLLIPHPARGQPGSICTALVQNAPPASHGLRVGAGPCDRRDIPSTARVGVVPRDDDFIDSRLCGFRRQCGFLGMPRALAVATLQSQQLLRPQRSQRRLIYHTARRQPAACGHQQRPAGDAFQARQHLERVVQVEPVSSEKVGCERCAGRCQET